ncbi:MAG: hypothetical protein PHZ07_04485 [Patescibacteria group bacterium]|nr:hypothetical protein [Patescibacteria group bacterium]MDD4304005.1 hypothetical protein [Patescibacteria group bacterium]MDD4695006.1 hypothetical protein [Patescibacteria group bacterium]
MKKHTKDVSGNLKLWRFITYLWAIFTAVIFIVHFFKILDCENSLETITLVYISILSIFTGIKETNRWKNKNFISKYKGEIFISIYTIIIIIFIILNTLYPEKYKMPMEFTATYLSILGIFAISSTSKRLKNK